MYSIYTNTSLLSTDASATPTPFILPTNLPSNFHRLLSTVTVPSNDSRTCSASEAGSFQNVTFSTFMVLLLLANVLGNSLIVLAVIMSRPLRGRVTFHFIVSLAFSDLTVGLFQIPFRISMRMYGNNFCHALPACYIQIISDVVGNIACILNLFLIAIDRFVAIKYALRYRELLTASRARKMIASVWVFAFILSFLGIFSWNPGKSGSIFSIKLGTSVCHNKNHYFYAAAYFGIYMPVLVVITCIYVMVLHAALTQIRAIEKNTVVVVAHKASMMSNGSNEVLENPNKRGKRRLQKELKATKSVAIVYLAFVICWLPSAVINIMIMIDNIFPDLKERNLSLFLFIYYLFIQILPVVNTMINPIIYSFSNSQFRRAFKNVCLKVTGKQLSWRDMKSFRSSTNTTVTFDTRSSVNNNHHKESTCSQASMPMLGNGT